MYIGPWKLEIPDVSAVVVGFKGWLGDRIRSLNLLILKHRVFSFLLIAITIFLSILFIVSIFNVF